MPDKTPEQIVQEAFASLKETNDANEKRRDALLEDKLAKINTTLDKFEPMNQAVTLAADKQKAMTEQLDKIETILNRGELGKPADVKAKKAAELRGAFNRCLRKTADQRNPADVALINEYRNTLKRGDDAGAGYLLAPADVEMEILKDIVELSPMRSLAAVRIIGGPSLKQVKRTGTASATRVGELGTRTNTGDPAYGMVEFPAPEMFARGEISMQMLEDEDYDLEAELRSEFGEQFAYKEGVEFVSGTGTNNQAEGMLTNASVGTVNSGAATNITADGIVNLFYGLKTGYGANAKFLMNRLTIREIRKLKDGVGGYLWVPGIPGVVPNTLLGAPYVEIPAMSAPTAPGVFTASTYPIAYGDYKRAYVIVDRVIMSFQSDFTTGADEGVVVYRARKRVGGGVRQADAVKKMIIAA